MPKDLSDMPPAVQAQALKHYRKFRSLAKPQEEAMTTKSKGKLVRVRWVQADGKASCYTCRYHDYDKLTPATHVIVKEFENATHKVYFCGDHFMPAWENQAA